MLDKSITNPGIHKQFLINRFNADEQRILQKLSADWYLTNSGEEVTAAQSRYNYFLMKPTIKTSEMFNIEREVVCIFSDYPYFEPRSLDIFDKVNEILPKMRAETVCGILISRAAQVEEKVDRLLKSDPEHPIIVPFTYSELLNNNTGPLIENRFRKHFFSRDLFSFLSPLKKDTYFFGRSQLINEIVNRAQSGEHTSLFGLRKSGKTSIVYAIERKLVVSGDNALALDCESPSVHLLRWYELLEKLVHLYHQSRESKIKLHTDGRYTEKKAADSFEEDVLKIFRSKKESSTLFIFDEIERLTPGTASSEHWRSGADFIYFWQTLRGLYQKTPGIFTYMLVGTNPGCIESPMLAGHENPIFASIPAQYVPNFEVGQVKQMVTKLGDYMGLKFDDLIAAKLTEDFGGHPFLVRQMCSLINQKASQLRPVRIDKALYQAAKVDFFELGNDYLEMMIQVLKDWYPDEYQMLTYLAAGDTESFMSFAADHTNYTRHLIGYGLIERGNGGYAFSLEAISELLKKKHQTERLNLTPSEKIQEISMRRTRLEKALRILLRNGLRTMHGAKKAAELTISALPETRRTSLAQLDLQALFDRDKSPLFFLELINIVKREWASVQNIFIIDKAKFTAMLEEINAAGRPDAHAKSISNDDFQQLRLHFKKIEPMLDDWNV
ncbi:hypothetical protein [Polaromonas sp. YR568]|uniref:hypothetical protein n=1 Tax=Polaromonas sp. YR568 TaxID=1855301 RepID=UPI003137797A